MEIKEYIHKVQYYETDQMGIVHHSNYIKWFEEARVDYMDQIGVNYSQFEKEGYLSPVVSIQCDYKTATKFGESVKVFISMESFNGVVYELSYKILNEVTDEICSTGKSKHCFVNEERRVISLKKANPKYYNLFMEAFEKDEK